MAGYVWNYTIDDSSSVFTFLPHGDGGADDFIQFGWQPWYSGSGFNTAGGEESSGQSQHITSLFGASVGLNFSGTAIYIFGSANGSYEVSLDGTVSSGLIPDSGRNLLFSQDNLSPGVHYVNLTAQPIAAQDQQIHFDGAVVTTTLDQEDPPVPVVYDNTNQSLAYNGTWSVSNANNIPSAANPAPFHQTKASGASVSLEFSDAVGIAINGTRNWGNWVYSVSLDGEQTSYNGSTMWLIGDALLFYANDLDPNKNHTVELINVSDGMNLWLNSITVFATNAASTTPNSTTVSTSLGTPSSSVASSASVTISSIADSAASKKTPVGEIVGPVVGVVVALALIAAAAIWFIKKKRSSNAREANPYPPILAGADSPYSSRNDLLFTTGTREKASLRELAAPLPPSITTAPQSHEPLSSVAQSPPASAVVQQPVDVDRLIELIAQRIDRAPGPPASNDPYPPPPQYPESMAL
ncbi:hypothetical protein OBBRIDRAFT_65288 [Obba rivulosa]|uniref:Uncharacterized protein n=1 Tax=Obba rivulosa TaxID=1052685 RepID=A0A8E2AVA6_9APHY|nr:hypothetical protein OBBRIDRAFT_65288 [Obba rivulosa]